MHRVLGAACDKLALAVHASDVHVAMRRTRAAAEALAEALGEGASAVGLDELAGVGPVGDVLMNTTSVGMAPNADASPVPAAALAGFALVFDAIYTPLETRLLQVRPPPRTLGLFLVENATPRTVRAGRRAATASPGLFNIWFSCVGTHADASGALG